MSAVAAEIGYFLCTYSVFTETVRTAICLSPCLWQFGQRIRWRMLIQSKAGTRMKQQTSRMNNKVLSLALGELECRCMLPSNVFRTACTPESIPVSQLFLAR